jgi:proteic killer suppression protein
VIISFRGRRTADCAARKRVKALSGVERLAWLTLDQLGAADSLGDVTALQSNGLETVNCDGHGPYAIRINEQWRICFEWPETSSGPMNVELVSAYSGGHMAPVTIHPGEHLAEALGALNMSATELARQINVPVNRVTDGTGRRAITEHRLAPSRISSAPAPSLAEPAKRAELRGRGKDRTNDSATADAEARGEAPGSRIAVDPNRKYRQRRGMKRDPRRLRYVS